MRDILQEVLDGGAGIPEVWKTWSAGRGLEFLRVRLGVTQDELARKSGVAQSGLSRIEGDEDALLSTWRKAYEAMGFTLLLLPVAGENAAELSSRAAVGRPPDSERRECRPRPRRRRAAPTASGGLVP